MVKRPSEKIWHNGSFVDWDDAKIHVMSHTVHYGSTLFEGIRCYDTRQGPAIFRLHKHIQRLFNSCKIYRMELPFTRAELGEACLETVRVNNLKECYIRPIALRGFGEFGVNPFPSPVEIFIAVYAWGTYLGPEAIEKGVDVCVSSWARMAPNTQPAMAKAGGNYMNSQLIKMEAIKNGYVEGIALDHNGYVSEGSGENIFVVLDGKVYTPALSASVLPGITRDSVIILCQDLGLEVKEQLIPRELLYVADEVFLSGTAAEITPVKSIDKIEIGQGYRGPITKEIQSLFFKVIRGETEDKYAWLTPVYKTTPLSKDR